MLLKFYRSLYSLSPLHAVQKNHEKNLADLNKSLHSAVKNNNLLLTETLLKQGADPNFKNKIYNSPLFQAYKNRNIELAKILISNGAEVNLKDERANNWLWNNIFSQGKL